MKKIILFIAFFGFINSVKATVILCNDEKLKCYVIHYDHSDGDRDACCWEFHMNPGSRWDCTQGSECQAFKEDDKTTSTRSTSNEGLQIIGDKIYDNGELIATMANPPNQKDIVSFSFDMPFKIGSFDFREDISTDNGTIYIGEEAIDGVEIDEGHTPIKAILTITKKEETASTEDIYFYENPNTINQLSFILPKDIISVHIIDEELNIVKNFKVNQSKMLERVDYSDLNIGKYYITFVSKKGKYTKQIIKI